MLVISAIIMVVGVGAIVYFGIDLIVYFIENKEMDAHTKDKIKKWFQRWLERKFGDDDRRLPHHLIYNYDGKKVNANGVISKIQRVMKKVVVACESCSSRDCTYVLLNYNFDQSILYEILSSSSHNKTKQQMNCDNGNIRSAAKLSEHLTNDNFHI